MPSKNNIRIKKRKAGKRARSAAVATVVDDDRVDVEYEQDEQDERLSLPKSTKSESYVEEEGWNCTQRFTGGNNSVILAKTVCDLANCEISSCEMKTCKEHGWGEANFEEGADHWTYQTKKCRDCDTYFCIMHHHFYTRDCTVCTDWGSMDAHPCRYNRPGVVSLCYKHYPTKCTKMIEGTEEVCEFRCCSKCLDNHTCGHFSNIKISPSQWAERLNYDYSHLRRMKMIP